MLGLYMKKFSRKTRVFPEIGAWRPTIDIKEPFWEIFHLNSNKKNNQSYDYKVSPDEMKEFINAPSKGQWINNIWKNYNRMPGF